MTKSKRNRTNFFVFLIVWTSTSLTYNDILLELGSVGPNIYINLCIIAMIEIFASYIAGYISLNFNIMNSFKYLLNFSLIFYLGFYFMPIKSNNFFILFVFMLCKMLSEIIYNLTNIYTPKMISEEYVAYFFIFIRLFSRILLLFLPHVNFLFTFLGVHPFVFLSVIYGISRFLVGYVEEPKK